MYISSNVKRAVFVVLLGGAIAASCALPGYETDPNLAETSSSSSSTSGTGQGGAGGGDNTGGAGGAKPDLIPLPVICPGFYDVAPKEGTSCAEAIDPAPMASSPKECGFAGENISAGCCVTAMICVESGAEKVWKMAPTQPPCLHRDSSCPTELGCMPPTTGNACPGTQSVEVLKAGAKCSCFAHSPTGGNPGQELPVCLIGKDGVCTNTPKELYPMLACVPDPINPMQGQWKVKDVGCCFPNPNQVMTCKIGGVTPCTELPLGGTGATTDFVCLDPMP